MYCADYVHNIGCITVYIIIILYYQLNCLQQLGYLHFNFLFICFPFSKCGFRLVFWGILEY